MVFEEAVEEMEEQATANGVHHLNTAEGEAMFSVEAETKEAAVASASEVSDRTPVMNPTKKENSSSAKPRILIIGAGMAGLCAARELQQRGYQTLIVEARHRPGGRLKTVAIVDDNNGDNCKEKEEGEPREIDVGGALIHGIVDNPLFEMVEGEMKHSTRPLSDCLLLSGDTGWPVDVALDERMLQSFNDCLAQTFALIDAQRQENSTQPEKEPLSFGSLFHRVCQERHVNAQQVLFQWHKANLEISCGESFQNLGLDWNDDEPFGFDGDHVALRNSWKPVCDSLAAPLYILYNAPVRRIQIINPPSSDHEPQEDEQFATSSSLSASPITPRRKIAKRNVESCNTATRQSRRLRGEDTSGFRRSQRANKGVLAPPSPISSPPLTTTHTVKRKQRKKASSTVVQVTMESGITWEVDAVVCTIPLGVLKDGSVTFDPPLPSEKQKAIQCLGTGLLNKCVLTFTKRFWQNSDFLGLADTSHSYLVLNAAKYTGKPVLLFMYGGSFAKEIEDWTDAAIVEDCLSVLRRMCGRDSVTLPLDYHVTRWGQDPYARMSFSYVPPGVDAYNSFSAMREPIYDHTGRYPILMFAGEHTTPYHPSTIHGAYFSGIREAYRWDCAWDPGANHGLEFSDDHIYQRTFAMKPRLSGGEARLKLPKGATLTKSPLIPPLVSYRRRRVNGEMALRRRPKSYIQMTSSRRSTSLAVRCTLPQGSPPAAVVDAGAIIRRSPRRSNVTVSSTVNGSDSATKEQLLTKVPSSKRTSRMISRELSLPLDQRILWRSVESFGPNFGYIERMIFPVPDSMLDKSSFRNSRQLEQRGRKFLEARDNSLAQRQKMIRFWYKSWMAK